MMKRCALLAFCLLATGLSAGSLRLLNDSPYKLRAVVRGVDGTLLGEVVINSQDMMTWTDEYPNWGGLHGGSMNPPRSFSPYQVYWYCQDGGDYGLNVNQGVGATVRAQNAEGPRICKVPPRSKKSPYGPQPGDEQLPQVTPAPPQSNPADLFPDQDQGSPIPDQ